MWTMHTRALCLSIGMVASLLACSSSDSGSNGGEGGAGGKGSQSNGSGAHHATSTTGTTNDATGTVTTGPTSTTDATSTTSTTSTTDATSTTAVTTTATTSTGSSDPYAQARADCLDEINTLRATKSLVDYGRWQSAETCVDGEVTSDETNNAPHDAWLNNHDSCMGSGQNECEGQGAAGIRGCIDSMWAEKDQPDCAGCDACDTAYDPSCPNCDFYGALHGQVCGHYVNLSAKYFSEVACGFSSLGGWDAMNFE
jgi:hypothetical protein